MSKILKLVYSFFTYIQLNKYNILKYLLFILFCIVFTYSVYEISYLFFSHYLDVKRIAQKILLDLSLYREKDPFLDPEFSEFISSYSQGDLLSQPFTTLLDIYSKMSTTNYNNSKIILELWFNSNYYGKVSLKVFIIKQILIDSPLKYDHFIREINNLFFKDYKNSKLSFDSNLYIDLIDNNKLIYIDPFYNIENKHFLDNLFGKLDIKLVDKYQLNFKFNKDYECLSHVDIANIDSNLKNFIFNFYSIPEEDPFCISTTSNLFFKRKYIDLFSFDSNITSKLTHGYFDFLYNNITCIINYIYDIFF